jgi:GDP-L-fucose synthase
MNKSSKIYVAGHDGLVGSAIIRNLDSNGYKNIITKTFAELNLIKQAEVETFFEESQPDCVIDAAAKVGGIMANNTYRGQFIYENMMIQNNLIHAAHKQRVKKFLFLGSSCIYPKNAPQPMREEYLLTDTLELTNEPYAIAKISGIKMCENYYRQYGDNYISVMPTNLYGFNDNFDLVNSHVLPAFIRKFHEAKIAKQAFVEIWGTGKPMREFLHVDDMAAACIHIMENIEAKQLYDEQKISHINIGTGQEISINDLALLVREIVGFDGKLVYDSSKPDGTARKLLDVSRLSEMGWRPKILLAEGIRATYEWFLKSENIRR